MYLSEFDIIYISYDEPNAEENWADLLTKAPWAKRVHGVKGFDSAHKAAAARSTTDRFITVDGDTKIVPEILQYNVDDLRITDKSIYSFSSKIEINGLVYGNGGLKCWPKEVVNNMKTHELSDGKSAKVDFCWDLDYVQFNVLSGISYQNGSAFQAFRSGFREGVKMSLDSGNKVAIKDFHKVIYPGNLRRLMVWCSVGNDIEFGNMAIYGARLGCYLTVCTDWDIANIRDYGWFAEYWDSKDWIKDEDTETVEYKEKLQKLIGLDICDLDSEQSKFFKRTYVNDRRV